MSGVMEPIAWMCYERDRDTRVMEGLFYLSALAVEVTELYTPQSLLAGSAADLDSMSMTLPTLRLSSEDRFRCL